MSTAENNTIAKRRAIAKKLLPLYNDWHTRCVHDFDSPETRSAERRLWAETKRYKDIGLPTKITASIGRWVARQLKMYHSIYYGVVNSKEERCLPQK